MDTEFGRSGSQRHLSQRQEEAGVSTPRELLGIRDDLAKKVAERQSDFGLEA